MAEQWALVEIVDRLIKSAEHRISVFFEYRSRQRQRIRLQARRRKIVATRDRD